MTIFVVRLEAKTGELAAIRGLRWILKTALRRYGLRCIGLLEENKSGAWVKMWSAPIKDTNPEFIE